VSFADLCPAGAAAAVTAPAAAQPAQSAPALGGIALVAVTPLVIAAAWWAVRHVRRQP
jgi:hypothetical protein